MAKERFKRVSLSGFIRIACKYDDGTVRYWEGDKAGILGVVQSISQQYQRRGYVLTLRQLHYQMVTRFPDTYVNHDSAYKKLGDILTEGRMAGVIDWEAFEDRGRVPYLPYWASDARAAVRDVAGQFRVNRQDKQPNVVELWTEKDALSGILKRTTEKYHINLVVNKGYTSSSAVYASYKRVAKVINAGKKFTILYFGDHDPSGLDMIRDIRDRMLLMLCAGTRISREVKAKAREWWAENQLTIFDLITEGYCSPETEGLLYDSDNRKSDDWADEFENGRIAKYLTDHELFQVVPIGLTREQISQFNLPPNPTKVTDSRAKKYIAEHGRTCWEVDALSPEDLTSIVVENIESRIDMDRYAEMLDFEEAELSKLKKIAYGDGDEEDEDDED